MNNIVNDQIKVIRWSWFLLATKMKNIGIHKYVLLADLGLAIKHPLIIALPASPTALSKIFQYLPSQLFYSLGTLQSWVAEGVQPLKGQRGVGTTLEASETDLGGGLKNQTHHPFHCLIKFLKIFRHRVMITELEGMTCYIDLHLVIINFILLQFFIFQFLNRFTNNLLCRIEKLYPAYREVAIGRGFDDGSCRIIQVWLSSHKSFQISQFKFNIQYHIRGLARPCLDLNLKLNISIILKRKFTHNQKL